LLDGRGFALTAICSTRLRATFRGKPSTMAIRSLSWRM
jgi:hypothetical protein